MATKRASHTFTLEPVGDGWYDLLPAGQFGGRDGRGPYVNDKPNGILAAFNALGMPMLIDYHHQSLDAEKKTGAVPAAGWGKAMRIDSGRIRCQIEWTTPAQTAIDAKELMYLSPVFDYAETDGRVIQIVCAGLTNLPNLHLAPLAKHSQENPMDEIVERIMYVLRLPATSTPDEIKTHFERVVAYLGGQGGVATTENAMKKAAHALGLPETATWADIATAAHTRLESGAMVPRAEYDRVAHAYAALQAEVKTGKVDAAVRAAMSAGKLAPAQEKWARDYASADLAGFESYIAATPTIVDPGRQTIPNGNPGAVVTSAHSLTVPLGKTVDTEKAELHNKAKAYQAAHSCTFIEAVKAVQAGKS